jgi:chitodextrinase
MTNSYTTRFTLALLASISTVKASISTEGLWTNNDWTETSTGYKFTNGVPGSDDTLTNRRITSPHALAESQLSDWETKANVQRVTSHLSEDAFDFFFPLADSLYTYENFLKAVAKFPAFCNEYNEDLSGLNTEDIDNTCKRELATLFAHIAYESGNNDPWDTEVDKYRQGLVYVEDDCAEDSSCEDNHETSNKYAAVTGK